MKSKLFIIVAAAALCFTSCGFNSDKIKEKAEKLLEEVKSQDEAPSQKEYSEALSILNENFTAQNKLVDEALQAVNKGDNEKATEMLNKVRDDENASQNSQLLSLLETADLDDSNKSALEEYKKNMQTLSDKITEVASAMIDLDI